MDVVETDEYPLIDDYLGSGVEFVEGSSGVKGRLKQCISYWKSTICAPQFVLGLISEGYGLLFVRFPDKCHLRNNRSAVRHPQFVEEAISKLLLNDCIQEHCSAFACRVYRVARVACVCYVCWAAWFVSVAALMRVLSVVLVV